MKEKQKSIWPCWPDSCSDVHLIKSSSFLFSGINEQGLYRIVGVNSRVQKLLSVLMGEFSMALSGLSLGQLPPSFLSSLWVRNEGMRMPMPNNLPCLLVVAVGMNRRGSEWTFVRLK